MKKILLCLSLIAVASGAEAKTGDRNPAKLNPDSMCKNKTSLKLATAAKDQYSDSILNIENGIPGANGIEVADCKGFYEADLLGVAHPQIAVSPHCGLRVLFKTKEDEKRFARTLFAIRKSTVSIYDGDVEKEIHLCGDTIGEIKPE